MLKNDKWILNNLKEAKEELDRTINEIECNAEYEECEFKIAMEHIYFHLNTAWNSRREDIDKCGVEMFDEWGKFPEDIFEEEEGENV